MMGGLAMKARQEIWRPSTQKQTEKTNGRGVKKKAKLCENRFRSGGEENERQMANNVMQDMRVL